MNEVRTTQVPASLPTRVASSQGTDGEKSLPPVGKDLPVKEDTPVISEVATIEIEEVVTEINEYVQSIQRDLHFSVDEDSGLTIIRVRDKETGELIRQIPEDIFLNLAQKLKDNQTLHLFDAHG
jgi:flagellar protein FlaG